MAQRDATLCYEGNSSYPVIGDEITRFMNFSPVYREKIRVIFLALGNIVYSTRSSASHCLGSLVRNNI